jgi:phosphoglycolate phosphatase-like HAD superfamily hydrolase
MAGSLHSTDALTQLKPSKDFFVGIDSDGCAFPTVEVKNSECLIPAIVGFFRLQAVSRYVRDAAEFVTLSSKWRGIDRFRALVMTIDLISGIPAVARAVKLPDIGALRGWTEREANPDNQSLKGEIVKNPDPVLMRALQWSEAVDLAVADMAVGVAPFPGARESLEALAVKADVMAVSDASGETLEREWKKQGMDSSARVFAGRESGTTKERLQRASGGKYPRPHTLMIGDTPDDLEAAAAGGTLFFPINPRHEEESWQRFREEGMLRFFSGKFAGAYEKKLVGEFKKNLPRATSPASLRPPRCSCRSGTPPHPRPGKPPRP